jgi:hypothetical protein
LAGGNYANKAQGFNSRRYDRDRLFAIYCEILSRIYIDKREYCEIIYSLFAVNGAATISINDLAAYANNQLFL